MKAATAPLRRASMTIEIPAGRMAELHLEPSEKPSGDELLRLLEQRGVTAVRVVRKGGPPAS
jgi:hypothetical protein